MRVVVAVIAVLVLAGCTAPAPAALTTSPSATQPTGRTVTGSVVDEELQPLPHVVVRVQDGNGSAHSGPNGTFVLGGLPAQNGLVLVAEHPEYVPRSLRVDLLFVPTAEVRFVLQPRPPPPSHVTTIFEGLVGCQASFGGHESPFGENDFDCAAPNVPTKEVSEIAYRPGAVALVLELVWTPQSQAADILGMDIDIVPDSGSPTIAEMHAEAGEHTLRAFFGPSTFGAAQAGGNVTIHVMVKPGVADDHFPANVGLAVQQDFQLHQTLFYGQAPNPSWTALSG